MQNTTNALYRIERIFILIPKERKLRKMMPTVFECNFAHILISYNIFHNPTVKISR